MACQVVSLPPATDTIPAGPFMITVSRRMRAVDRLATGSTRTPAKRERTRRSSSRQGSRDSDASARIWRWSSSVAMTAAGSPSNGSSVVPSSSMPSHGIANETRPLASGVVNADNPSPSASSSRCAPLERRTLVPAPADSMRRTLSTHGPVALTTLRAVTASAAPESRSTRSAPVTRPPVIRSAATPTYGATIAPCAAAACAAASVNRPSWVRWSW